MEIKIERLKLNNLSNKLEETDDLISHLESNYPYIKAKFDDAPQEEKQKLIE